MKTSLTDALSLVTVDQQRGKRITVFLKMENGDTITLKEITTKLTQYLNDQVRDKKSTLAGTNPIINQIMPLIAQASGVCIPSVTDEGTALALLCVEQFRWSIVMMGMLGFSLMKFINDQNLKIITEEEDLTLDEIEEFKRISRVSSASAAGAMMGHSPQEIIRDLIRNGDIRPEEVEDLLGEQDED